MEEITTYSASHLVELKRKLLEDKDYDALDNFANYLCEHEHDVVLPRLGRAILDHPKFDILKDDLVNMLSTCLVESNMSYYCFGINKFEFEEIEQDMEDNGRIIYSFTMDAFNEHAGVCEVNGHSDCGYGSW